MSSLKTTSPNLAKSPDQLELKPRAKVNQIPSVLKLFILHMFIKIRDNILPYSIGICGYDSSIGGYTSTARKKSRYHNMTITFVYVSSKGDWRMNHYVERAKQNVLTRLDEENLMTALVGVLVSPAGWQEEK